MSEQQKELVRAIFDRMINGRDLGVVDELFDEDFVTHTPIGDIQGREAFSEFVGAWLAGFPDARVEVLNVITEGELAAWLVHFTGADTGGFMGAPPTGRSIDTLGVNMGRQRDGRIVEHWVGNDWLQAFQQLGFIELPVAASAA